MPGREEACDKRSAPREVTSSWARRGGVNLQQEVVPQQTERPPRDSPVEDTPDRTSGAKVNIQADGAGITAFRGLTSLQPAPLLNFIVQQGQFRILKRLIAFQNNQAFS